MMTSSMSKKYREPVKLVKSAADLPKWKASQAFHSLMHFIASVNNCVIGKKRDVERARSPTIQRIIDHVRELRALVDAIPPIQQPMRFGNKAFRTWHTRMMEEMRTFHESILSPQQVADGAVDEVSKYFVESFGSLQRIDYGTGHELNFVAWMCCLDRLGLIEQQDYICVAFDVFHGYLELMRHLQRTYWLEPAGSKGVWGLDDYQFLPFVFGASQLVHNQDDLRPIDVCDNGIVDRHADQYLYFECIQFVNSVKSGAFAQHSPILNDISALSQWQRVNRGLVKMYNVEVLGKFPVIQHFFFGTLLPFSAAAAAAPPPPTSSDDPPVQTTKLA